MNLDELRALASSVGFPDSAVDTAAAIAMAESGGDPCANGDPRNPSDCSNDYNSTSFGLWQVHVPAHPEYDSASLKNDPEYSARAALAISSGGRNFHPWSTFNPSPDGSPPKYLQYIPEGGGSTPVVSGPSPAGKVISVIAAIAAVSIILSEVARHGGVARTWRAIRRTI